MFYNLFKSIMLKFVQVGHISVFIDDAKYYVHFRKVRDKRIVKEDSRYFDCLEENKITKTMRVFFDEFYSDVRYAYVSTINLEKTQGLLLPNTLESLDLNTKDITTLQLGRGASVFSLNKDLQAVQKAYDDIHGVDFIFPLEAVIEHLRPRSDSEQTDLNIISTKDHAFICIYHDNKIVYTAHFKLGDKDAITIKDPVQEDEPQENEEDFSGLGGLADLGDIDNLDDFIAGDESDDAGLQDEPQTLQSEDEIKRDLALFEFIDRSLKEFYKNPDYPSDFISNIYMYQPIEINSTIKKHLQDLFFFEPQTININLPKILCDLSIIEAKK